MATSSPELAMTEVFFSHPPWKLKFLPPPVSLSSPPRSLLEFLFKALTQLGAAAYTFNPSTRVEQAGGLLQVQG